LPTQIPAAKRPACNPVWCTSPVPLLLLHDLATAPILSAAVSFVAHTFSADGVERWGALLELSHDEGL
jgi:hypothetical protein